MRTRNRPPNLDGAVIARLGPDPEGTTSLESHQPRHLRKTDLKKGNLSEAALATMAGRIDPRQNRHYDHRTRQDPIGRVARGTGRSEWVGPLAGLHGDKEDGDDDA